MISRAFEAITFADILGLVEAARPEDRRLDLKRELPGGKDDDKKEFLADVSSLANADGGDLIFGVDEVDGVASGNPGVEIADPDSVILRLESLARDGLQPRIIGLRSTFVPDPGRPNVGVLVIRVPASLQSPHRVSFRSSNRFYTRHSKGKAEMDVHELRQAFTDAEGTRPRLRALHGMLPRLSSVPLLAGPSLLVSVAPINIFRRRQHLEISGIEDAVRPTFGSSMDWSHTLEGFLVWSPTSNGAYSQALTYRTGLVELWSGQGSMAAEGNPWVWAGRIEKDIRTSVSRALAVLSKHEVEGPWFASVTLKDVTGKDLHTGDRWGEPKPTNRSSFSFNDLVFDELNEDTLLPIYRELWWGFGQDRPKNWKAAD